MKYYWWLCSELWWQAEKAAGWLWLALSRDRVSYWLDWLPAMCSRKRYKAQRRLNVMGYTTDLRKI